MQEDDPKPKQNPFCIGLNTKVNEMTNTCTSTTNRDFNYKCFLDYINKIESNATIASNINAINWTFNPKANVNQASASTTQVSAKQASTNKASAQHIKLNWQNMQTHGSDQEKKEFYCLREQFVKILEKHSKCIDQKTQVLKWSNSKCKKNNSTPVEKGYFTNKIIWNRVGSDSINSDIDITLIPPYINENTNDIVNYYDKIKTVYNKYFNIDMATMFDINIYATPFMFVTDNPIGLDTVLFKEINLDLDQINYLDLSCFCSPPNILRKKNSPTSTRLSRTTCNGSLGTCSPISTTSPTGTVTSIFSEYPNFGASFTRSVSMQRTVTLTKKLYFLNIDPSNITQLQYSYAATNLKTIFNKQYLNNIVNKRKIKNLIENETIQSIKKEKDSAYYNYFIQQYYTTISNFNKIANTAKFAKFANTALDYLCKSTFYIDEAYHTQGTMLHVTCPQEFRQNCFKELPSQYFVCSVFENLAYACEKWNHGSLNYKLKTCKYIERICDAFLIIYQKQEFKNELDLQHKHCFCYKPTIIANINKQNKTPKPKLSIIKMHAKLLTVYNLSKDLNEIRKESDENILKRIAETNKNIDTYKNEKINDLIEAINNIKDPENTIQECSKFRNATNHTWNNLSNRNKIIKSFYNFVENAFEVLSCDTKILLFDHPSESTNLTQSGELSQNVNSAKLNSQNISKKSSIKHKSQQDEQLKLQNVNNNQINIKTLPVSRTFIPKNL